MTESQPMRKRTVKTSDAKGNDAERQTANFQGKEFKSRQPKTIVQFFRESPWMDVELDLERDRDMGREFKF